MAEEDDIRPETDEGLLNGDRGEVHLIVENDDDDVHVCRKCNFIFYNVEEYLEHKVKHDNFKIQYGRSNIDKRMVLPKLIQKAAKKQPSDTTNEEPKKKVGRKKKQENVEPKSDGTCAERAGYSCQKCGRKFNREASLKRHLDYDHRDSDLDDSDVEKDEEAMMDDNDEEFKPDAHEAREAFADDEEAEEVMEEEGIHDGSEEQRENLDKVIMAAAILEAQDQNPATESSEGSKVQDQTKIQKVFVITSSGEKKDITLPLASGSPVKSLRPTVAASSKKGKASEEDKALRKYACKVCDSKFKELTVLKAHMLTHSNRRQFFCPVADCTYAFKTKGCLKRHMRRHTGERPYPCELCGRTFAESGALTRHLKSRTPCTRKADSDLPRYGKKWTYTPNIPAAQAGLEGHTGEGAGDQTQEDPASDVAHNQEEQQHVVHIVTEVGGTEEGEATLRSLQSAEHILVDSSVKDMLDIQGSTNVEVVISEDTDMVEDEDDSIQQFAHSETVVQASSGSTVCKVCFEDQLSVEALKVHLRTHLADNTLKCLLCHFNCDNKEDFESHMFMQHDVQLKPLDVDPAEDVSLSKNEHGPPSQMDAQTAVKQLMELMHGNDGGEADTRVSCPVCQKNFSNTSYLKMHIRNHTGVKHYKCTECDKSFINKDTLSKHMSAHLEERNFKCGKCGKLFKRLSHVREHIKIHAGSRPFPCTICEKSFKTSNAMKVHLRTHSDIMPYECNFCHRRFREKGSVIRHTRMHTGERPFSCQYCGKRFAEHGTLNRHLRAKVACKRQAEAAGRGQEAVETDYTMLTEFSSVVANTQQYIVAGEEGETSEHEAEITEHEAADHTREFLFTYTNEDGQIIENAELSNVQIIASDEQGLDNSGLQVNDDYIVVTDEGTGTVRVLDKKTGKMVAEVPLASESSDSHIQSITMSQDGVSLVTLLSSDDGNLSQGQVMSEGQLINIANIVQGNANIVQGNGDASDMYENSMDNLENATSLSGVVIQENGVQYIVTSIDKENESHNESDHESDNVRTENE